MEETTKKSNPKQDKSDKNEKREQILNAAFQLFEETGYEKTKIIDIADAAGIGKGTVYEYFPSKSDLAAEWMRRRVEKYRETYLSIPTEKGTAKQKLTLFIENDSVLFSDIMGNMDILIKSSRDFSMIQNLSDDFHDRIKKLFLEEMNVIVKIIEEGVNSGEFAPGDNSGRALAIMGAIGFYVSFGKTTGLVDSDEMLINFIFNGLS